MLSPWANPLRGAVLGSAVSQQAQNFCARPKQKARRRGSASLVDLRVFAAQDPQRMGGIETEGRVLLDAVVEAAAAYIGGDAVENEIAERIWPEMHALT